MHARAKGPKLRKIDVRIPELSTPLLGRSPLLDDREHALLRRIDGQSTVNALASSMGLAVTDVARALAKMERLRLVTFLAQRRTASSSPPVRLRSGMRPAMATIPSVFESPPPANVEAGTGIETKEGLSSPDMEPLVLEEEPLSLGFLERGLVAAIAGRLGELTHYEVLGVPTGAHADVITRAYFVLVSAFHSGRFSEESSGVRRDHLDAVRARATLAHDTLSSAERRAVYDVLLYSLARTRQVHGADDLSADSAGPPHPEARPTLTGLGPLPRERAR
jgi:hypothetical protein